MPYFINRRSHMRAMLIVGFVFSAPCLFVACRGFYKVRNIHASMAREEEGEKLLEAGNITPAIEKFQSILASNPDLSTGYNTCMTRYHLGIALAEQKKYAEAIPQFRAAIREYGEMIAEAAERLKGTPTVNSKEWQDGSVLHQAYFELGNALNAQGKRTEARAAWRSAFTLLDKRWNEEVQEQLDKNPEIKPDHANGSGANAPLHIAASGRGGNSSLTVTKSSGRARVETLCTASKITTSA